MALERDAESGTEHAQFRNYASAQGRWLGPDSYLGSYDLTNPQSMNRYTYVLNNPLSLIDPLGLEDPDCGADDTVCVNGGGGGDPGDPTDPDPSDPGNPGAPTNGGGGSNPKAPKNSNAKQVYACRADAVFQTAIGFVPFANAAKLALTAAGVNFNVFQNVASGQNIVTFTNPLTTTNAVNTALWGANTLASTYQVIMDQVANIGSGAVLQDVAEAASTAGGIANVLNLASGVNSLIACGTVHQ